VKEHYAFDIIKQNKIRSFPPKRQPS